MTSHADLKRLEEIYHELQKAEADFSDNKISFNQVFTARAKFQSALIPCGTELVAQNAALLERIARLDEALREMVKWHGPLHETECPSDDTCSCQFKPINDKVNAALASAEQEKP